MSGREDYEERRQARIDRLNARAGKEAERSEAEYKRSHDLVKDIPLGQPNIEGRPALPNLRAKSGRAMDRSIEHERKAVYYADRAEAAESNRAISSDDPQAIEKLRKKLAELEAERERVKAFNKEARKNGTAQAPWYTLPYLSRDIKTVKERIAKLERVEAMPAEVIPFDGGEIISDVVLNRVVIRHGEKPDSVVIERLKSNGFHWSRTEWAWLRLRSPAALAAARLICGVEPERR